MIVRGYAANVSDPMGHAFEAGFTANGKLFGYCRHARNPFEPTQISEDSCESLPAGAERARSLGVPLLKSEDWQWKPIAITGANSMTNDDTMNVVHPPAITGNIAFSRDFSYFIWTPDAVCNEVAATCSLHITIGGKYMAEADIAVTDLNITALAHHGLPRAHIDYMGLSADGTELGIVGHKSGCMTCSDPMVLHRIKLANLASRILHGEALKHHLNKQFELAAQLWEKAHVADPQDELPLYDLACAYTQLQQLDRAQSDLAKAIELGGQGVKTRAKKDSDFKSVADTDWFRQLTQ